jgi:hypothetical protein
MKGVLLGMLLGLGLCVLAVLMALTKYLWAPMPAVIAFVLVIGLFGYIGKDLF